MRLPIATLVLGVSVVIAGTASAADIRGTISSPVTITEDSQLIGNVTCTVIGAACITIGAPGIALKLNGFSITGQGDAVTGCAVIEDVVGTGFRGAGGRGVTAEIVNHVARDGDDGAVAGVSRQ